MLTGAELAKLGRWSLCALLIGCGGRTLDDGVYEADGASSDGSSCTYRNQTYVDGSAVPGVCFCFCNQGRIECETGCSSPSGGASSGGTSGSGGTVVSTGATTSGGTAGASSGGTTSSSGATSTGGTIGIGATGGIATAGSTSSGGSIGEGGVYTGGYGGGTSLTCTGPVPIATGTQPLIDSMEDNDAFISFFDGRVGGWYTYNDGTGAQLPPPSAFAMQFGVVDPTGGKVVANTYGKGFSDWGAGMGFVLNDGCPYNAKIYSGLSFYAKVEYGSPTIEFAVGTAATTPVASGGTCTGVCYDNFQVPIVLGPVWQEFMLPFSVLQQQGWGTPAYFDPATLVNVNFQTEPGAAESFSFSIDSISFY